MGVRPEPARTPGNHRHYAEALFFILEGKGHEVHDGVRHGVIFEASNYAMFYNADLIKNPPKTWDQMIDDAIVKNPKQRTASFYDILPPNEHSALKPPGTARLAHDSSFTRPARLR